MLIRNTVNLRITNGSVSLSVKAMWRLFDHLDCFRLVFFSLLSIDLLIGSLCWLCAEGGMPLNG